MPPRQKVQNPFERPPGFTPQAGRTRSLVPPTPALEGSKPIVPTGLSELAKGLQQFNAALAPLARQERERREEEMTMEGAAEAQRLIEQDAKSFKQAVKEGLISETSNPWRRLGMLRAFGEVEGDRYATSLRAFMQDRVLSGAVDVENWQEAEIAFRNQWVEENVSQDNRTGVFEQVFAQRVNAASRSIGQEFAQQAGIESGKRRLDQAYELIQGNLDAAIEAGIDWSDPNAVRQVIELETARLDEAVQIEGIDGTRINETFVDAVVDRAIAEGDPNILSIIEDSAVANTRYAREALADGVVAINRQVGAERQFSEGQRKERIQNFLEQSANEMANDREGFIRNSRQIIKDAAALGPEAIAGVEALIDTQVGIEGVSDPEVFADLSIAIAEGTATDHEIKQAREAGLLSATDAATLQRERINVDQGGSKSPFNDDAWNATQVQAQIANALNMVPQDDPVAFERVTASIQQAWAKEYRERNLATAPFEERSNLLRDIIERNIAIGTTIQGTRGGVDSEGRQFPGEFPEPREIQEAAEQGVENYLGSGPNAAPSPAEVDEVEQEVNKPVERSELETETGRAIENTLFGIGDAVQGLYERTKERITGSPEDIDDQIQRIEERLDEGDLSANARKILERTLGRLERRKAAIPDSTSSEEATGTVEPEEVSSTGLPSGFTPKSAFGSVAEVRERATELSPLINQAADENGVSKPFFYALLNQEAGFRSDLGSPAGAQGIAQFMPATGRAYGLNSVADREDPTKAIPASAAHLRDLLDEFGDWGRAAWAYNAGGGRVGKMMPKETRGYILAINRMAPGLIPEEILAVARGRASARSVGRTST